MVHPVLLGGTVRPLPCSSRSRRAAILLGRGRRVEPDRFHREHVRRVDAVIIAMRAAIIIGLGVDAANRRFSIAATEAP